jgi:hypothetical protein
MSMPLSQKTSIMTLPGQTFFRHSESVSVNNAQHTSVLGHQSSVWSQQARLPCLRRYRDWTCLCRAAGNPERCYLSRRWLHEMPGCVRRDGSRKTRRNRPGLRYVMHLRDCITQMVTRRRRRTCDSQITEDHCQSCDCDNEHLTHQKVLRYGHSGPRALRVPVGQHPSHSSPPGLQQTFRFDPAGVGITHCMTTRH